MRLEDQYGQDPEDGDFISCPNPFELSILESVTECLHNVTKRPEDWECFALTRQMKRMFSQKKAVLAKLEECKDQRVEGLLVDAGPWKTVKAYPRAVIEEFARDFRPEILSQIHQIASHKAHRNTMTLDERALEAEQDWNLAHSAHLETGFHAGLTRNNYFLELMITRPFEEFMQIWEAREDFGNGYVKEYQLNFLLQKVRSYESVINGATADESLGIPHST